MGNIRRDALWKPPPQRAWSPFYPGRLPARLPARHCFPPRENNHFHLRNASGTFKQTPLASDPDPSPCSQRIIDGSSQSVLIFNTSGRWFKNHEPGLVMIGTFTVHYAPSVNKIFIRYWSSRVINGINLQRCGGFCQRWHTFRSGLSCCVPS